MAWKKKGLIFCPDGKSEYMNSHAAIPFADLINDEIIRIYFSSRNNRGESLPFCVDVNSENICSVISVIETPLLRLGRLGSFDDSGIMPSCIVNNGNVKYMYYIGWNKQVNVSYRLSIGLAVSHNNGFTFEKYSEGPISDRSINEPFFNTAPFVLIENGIWRMWYISCTEWQIINNYPEPRYHVKYSESKDGINWVKNNIICIDYDHLAEAIGRPCVFYENGIYKMYFSYRKILNYRNDRNNSYKIGYAESNDGIKWKKYYQKDVIELGENKLDWDYSMIEYCHVFKNNGSKIMLYNGNGFGKSGFGYAKWEDESV